MPKTKDVPITEHKGYAPRVVLDLDDPEHIKVCTTGGGRDLIQVIIKKGGKETHAYVHCGTGGGLPDRAQLTLTVKRPNGETTRTVIAKPWIVSQED